MLADPARIRAAPDTPIRRISFAIGPLYVLGAISFCLGSAALLSPGAWSESWPTHKALLLIDIPFMVRPCAPEGMSSLRGATLCPLVDVSHRCFNCPLHRGCRLRSLSHARMHVHALTTLQTLRSSVLCFCVLLVEE
jgi:hypothetical protein